jgi:hypothetical protein
VAIHPGRSGENAEKLPLAFSITTRNLCSGMCCTQSSRAKRGVKPCGKRARLDTRGPWPRLLTSA